MQATIKLQNLKHEFFTEEKCFITEISNSVMDDPEVSIARARLEPNGTYLRDKVIINQYLNLKW